ncbi:MAG: ATPase, T2SS/T4P/T4SS family [Candidatus Malihini olakiniferum]
MIGEIRDGETAEIAVEAAYTGHLVLRLHTNSAIRNLTWLVHLGIPGYLWFDVSAYIHCKTPASQPLMFSDTLLTPRSELGIAKQ